MLPDRSAQPKATVLITTKNRKEELRDAIKSVLAQSVPVETLIIDDGSTDGTSDLVTSEFGNAVRLQRYEQSAGLIGRRNDGAQLASTPIIFSIDDDAAFASRYTVEQTLANFDDPRVAAVAIPFINVRQDNSIRQIVPGTVETYVCSSYIGTAHALRRDLFLKLGGYVRDLVHQGEEDDFCARLYDAGYVVRIGTADPIHHFESPNRNWGRMTYYGQRNNILYTWQNVPMPDFLVHLPATSLKGLIFGVKVRRFWLTVKGQSVAVGQIVAGKFPRRPVRRCIYRLLRELRKVGPRPLREIESRLPAISPAQPAAP